MSLRPMLYATDVRPLLLAASSHDMSLVERIVDWFRERLDDPEPATLEMAKRETENLLSGAYAQNPESEDHVNIVMAMAVVLGVQNDEAMIADGTWKQSGWDNYLEVVGPSLPASAKEQFSQLMESKRPIFGSMIDSGWSYYGYLLNSEVSQLRATLEQVAASHPIASPDATEFHDEFMDWLRQVEERKTDLWLFAS